MNVKEIRSFIRNILETDARNHVEPSAAIRPDITGMRMYEDVHIGVARASDPYFDECMADAVVGRHFKKPKEWLSEARSVLSVFFSLTDRVVRSNANAGAEPSAEWLHARIEGQAFIGHTMRALEEALKKAGHDAVVPSSDPRFISAAGQDKSGAFGGKRFTSVWSERHIAYACGLGTFSLSRGIITRQGTAGRLGSVVTTLELVPSERAYASFMAYCSMCGACAARCPADAIVPGEGKDQVKCSAYLDRMLAKFSPRYGCGKCQVGVPCERSAPTIRM